MRFLLTRPYKDSMRLADLVQEAGHTAIVSPLLEIVPLPWTMPDAQVDAVVLTSHNAVSQQHLQELSGLTCYCIGAATADAAHVSGLNVVAHAEGERAGLVAKIAADKPRHVLFLSGHLERADLIAELAQAGVMATKKLAYEAQELPAFSHAAHDALSRQEIDWVLLYSPRSATVFCRLFDAPKSSVRLACLSSAVADTCGADWAQIVVAAQPSTSSLLAACGIMCDRADNAASRTGYE
jgi:uroporphyrinogen-III synthase